MKLQLTLRDLFWLTALVGVLVAWWLNHAGIVAARRSIESDRAYLENQRQQLEDALAASQMEKQAAEQSLRSSEEYRRGYFYWRESLEPLKRDDDGI